MKQRQVNMSRMAAHERLQYGVAARISFVQRIRIRSHALCSQMLRVAQDHVKVVLQESFARHPSIRCHDVKNLHACVRISCAPERTL